MELQAATASFISPPSASVSFPNIWLSWHSCSSSQTTDLAHLPSYPPQSSAPIPYRSDSDISSPTFLSYVWTVLCFPLPFMFWLHADSDTSAFILFSSPLPSFLWVYSTPLPSLCLCVPLSCSLQVAVHNQTCFHSCMPTAHLYPSNHLSSGSDAPHGASKQDAWGMKNKHSRLSSSFDPSNHSFTCKDEAILCEVWKQTLNSKCPNFLSHKHKSFITQRNTNLCEWMYRHLLQLFLPCCVPLYKHTFVPQSLNELQTEAFNGAAVACWALRLWKVLSMHT